MPELVRLYIRNAFYGAGLSLVFLAMLLGFNVANLRHLILGSDIGYIAILLLFVFNTLVFAGVQFSIAVMRMAQDDTPPGGGHRDPVVSMDPAAHYVPVPVPVSRKPAPRRR